MKIVKSLSMEPLKLTIPEPSPQKHTAVVRSTAYPPRILLCHQACRVFEQFWVPPPLASPARQKAVRTAIVPIAGTPLHLTWASGDKAPCLSTAFRTFGGIFMASPPS